MAQSPQVEGSLARAMYDSDAVPPDYVETKPSFEVDYSAGGVVRDRPNNILVPIGCAVTAGVLCVGLYSFVTGNTAMSQKMMRARLMAQGATVAAMTLSMPWLWGGGKKQEQGSVRPVIVENSTQ